MKKYEIVKLDNELFDYLIIANMYENQINDLIFNCNVPFLENGNIIFDLTIINGLSGNRYVSAQVKDSKILINSLKTYSKIDNIIFNITKKYFIDNSNIVMNSYLPNAVKYKILN